MKKIIHLVQTNDVIGTNIILPLAVGILWQYSQLDPENQQKWQLGQVVYKRLESTNDVELLSQGHMIVFSNYVWNSAYHFELARQVKKLNPDIFVVMGGPNISPNKKDFWDENQTLIDLALVGEGEHVFSDLLKTWPNHTLQPGMWTHNYYQGESDRVQDFPYQASPYLSGFYDHIVQQEQQQGNMIQAVIQTNRGCPYHCTFCEEGRDYKNKMFFYDLQRIQDEIKWCSQNCVEYLSIADDNWGIVDQDVEIMRWIRDSKLINGYPTVVDATYAKNNPENLLAMAKLDQEHDTRLIRGITVALQSHNPTTLNSIKRFNLIPEKQQKLIVGLKKLNVPTYCEMIWPLPYETYESFCRGIDQTIEIGLDNWLGVYPLSLHPGTELYEQYHDCYTIIQQQSENANRADQVETVPIVTASRWVNNLTIVRGQVLYTWLVCLFYFGFGRHSLEQLPITKTVDEFLNWAESNPNRATYKIHKHFEQWWFQWLSGYTPHSLSMFDEDTTHWSPYTHLASWLQDQWDDFYQDWKDFLLELHGIQSQDQIHTIRYGQIYKNLGHSPPEFSSLFEFSRYYYWWTRKRGYSRL
jgi:radical SAM superfamily enzyme YgiQ (UPF0313 family)